MKKHPIEYVKAAFAYWLRWVMPIYAIVMIESITVQVESWNINWFWTALFIFLFWGLFIHWVTSYFRDRWWVSMWSRLYIDIYEDVIKKFLWSSNTAVEKMWTGKVIAIVEKWMKTWSDTMSKVIITIPAMLLSVFYTAYLLARSGWWILLFFIVVIVVVQVIVVWLNAKVTERRNITRDIDNERVRMFVKVVMSKFEIIQNNKVDYEVDNLKENSMKKYDNDVKRSFVTDLFFRVPQISMLSMRVLVYAVIWYGVLQNNFTFADLVVFTWALTLMDWVIGDFVDFYFYSSREFSFLEKLWSTLDNLPLLQKVNNWTTFKFKSWHITFSNITFWYEDRSILENLSLDIQGWKKTALVWHSGWGKTTLMKLIAWYIVPDSWSLIVDNQNLSEISLHSYYKHIWYLTQEPSVFDGSIRENLIYALEKPPTDKKLQEVIKHARCEFVLDFKNGLDTEIWERGIRLSWWQKQRLAIAKIMLKDPEIILLDEPTSALDSVSEQMISDALHFLFKWRTVIVIAHRLQTVKEADEILVIEHWKIVQRWSHKDLEHQKGTYQDMLRLQTTF